MDQSRASDHRGHQDAGSNESHLRLGKRVLPTYLPPGQELAHIGQQKKQQKNGGGGVFIELPGVRFIRKSVATGQQSTNYSAEAYALLAAAKTLNQEERLHTNTVFLTDCRSILQSLQSPEGDQMFSNIRQELSLLKNKTSATLQWIPSTLTVVLETMRKQTGCQKWEASWSNLHTPCPAAMQRPS